MVGSLTGVVASKRVTEAFKGTLSTNGNRTKSALAQGCLTVETQLEQVRKQDKVIRWFRMEGPSLKG